MARKTVAKGRRPFFLENPDSDKLLAMITAMTAEISILKDRLDTHERLSDMGEVATSIAIERYKPDTKIQDIREANRARLLERIFRIISDQDSLNQSDADYNSLIEKFSAENSKDDVKR
ncbi:MAG: hypothetical protein CMM25_01210 [Rhodospirillaceae bacterium]|nr:hypothetical protein [Rhodospirillaceae bacterium]